MYTRGGAEARVKRGVSSFGNLKSVRVCILEGGLRAELSTGDSRHGDVVTRKVRIANVHFWGYSTTWPLIINNTVIT